VEAARELSNGKRAGTRRRKDSYVTRRENIREGNEELTERVNNDEE
jgi:hypothetical protein